MSDEESRDRAILEAEEQVRERVDPDGTRWVKVYFGSGEHLSNWLDQCRELAGEENVRTEAVAPVGLACFSEGDEGFFRVWVRKGSIGQGDD
jgi:hypothetical protein